MLATLWGDTAEHEAHRGQGVVGTDHSSCACVDRQGLSRAASIPLATPRTRVNKSLLFYLSSLKLVN